MAGAQASVLQLLLALAPVGTMNRYYYSSRLELELQLSDYYFTLLLKDIQAWAPILQLL